MANRPVPAVVAVFFLWTVSVTKAEEPNGSDTPGYIEGPSRFAVTRARAVAVQRLGHAGCSLLFREFADLQGRALADVLEARQETPEGHLLWMVFRDGVRSRACARPGVFAFTSLGSQTVYLCPAFTGLMQRKPLLGAHVLIHEELHSLGAGEAPIPDLPTSKEITDRVARRCGG